MKDLWLPQHTRRDLVCKEQPSGKQSSSKVFRLFQGKEPCQEYRNTETISLHSKEVKNCGVNPLLSEAWSCTELNRRYHAGASLEAGEPELHGGADSIGRHTKQDPTNCKGRCDSHLNSLRSIRACNGSGAFALLSSAHIFLPSSSPLLTKFAFSGTYHVQT